MRILIDIGHPAHVHYFKNMIKILQSHNVEFLITARNRSEVFHLLKYENLDFESRGKGRDSLIGKFFYMIFADLFLLVKSIHFKPDLFISFASPYAAQVATLIHKPHIVFNDTEHAKLGLLSFLPFSDVVIAPKSFYKNIGEKLIRFDGTMELAYLHKNRFIADIKIYELLGLDREDKYCIMRFVSWKASHDVGRRGLSSKSKIEIVMALSQYIKVLISSESDLPPELQKFRINIPNEQMHNAIAFSSLYVGEGATMASESSVLGIPAIYINSLPLMGYLKEQQEAGLLFHFKEFSGVIEKAIEIINTPKAKWGSNQSKYLRHKIDVTAFMVWFIENYPASEREMRNYPEHQFNFR